MNEYIIHGFNDEMEKLALWGAIAKTGLGFAKAVGKPLVAAAKPLAKVVKKNPMNTFLVGSGAAAGMGKIKQSATAKRLVPYSRTYRSLPLAR